MKSCGLIVEYNPFHNGHRYHIEAARAASNCDVVVAIMSGNFLQRGEPACMDKWSRAEAALQEGANLVVELPFAHAVQSADYFARGGVQLLAALGVDSLCFGTDLSSDLDYEAFGRAHLEHESAINDLYQAREVTGESYPERMTAIYRQLLPEWTLDFSSPNHILGMAYAKENAKLASPMQIFPIQRQGSNYHESELNPINFSSATAIRQAVKSGTFNDLSSAMPTSSQKLLQESPFIDWEYFWPLLKYRLLTTTPEQLRSVYQMKEGFEYRLLEKVKQANSFQELMTLAKTKRYTWTRIQRLLTYVLLNVTESEIMQVREHPYIRVLGFDETGRDFLKQQKGRVSIPLITNVNRKNESLLALDIKAGQVYQTAHSSLKQQDYYRAPHYN